MSTLCCSLHASNQSAPAPPQRPGAWTPGGNPMPVTEYAANGAAGQDTIRLEPLRQETFLIPIRGVTPLIPHQWSEKSKRQMREKQSGSRVKAKLDPKDPVQEAEAATYYLPD